MPGQKWSYPCNWLQIMENTMDPAHTAFLHTIVSGAVFTDEFGVLPELDFVETPIGMIYVATRRVGDNVWARMVEGILPNLQQVAPLSETGRREHPFSGPMMTPLAGADRRHQHDVHRAAPSQRNRRHPAVVGRPQQMMPGQIAMDTYEESQRHPGDFEAQVSQRPIAVHGLEHLERDRPRRQHVPQPGAARHPRRRAPARTPAGLVRDGGRGNRRPTATTPWCACRRRRRRGRQEDDARGRDAARQELPQSTRRCSRPPNKPTRRLGNTTE